MTFHYSLQILARTLSSKELNNAIDTLIESERRATDEKSELKRKVINDLAEYLDVKVHNKDDDNNKKRILFPGVLANGLRGKKDAEVEYNSEKKDGRAEVTNNEEQDKRAASSTKQLDETALKKLNDVLKEIL